ncbi:hypothetical protein WMY93_032430, partial [Mugilogobius chulae]
MSFERNAAPQRPPQAPPTPAAAGHVTVSQSQHGGGELPSEFDVVIVGTGLCESVVAAACSRVGQRVLHLDRRSYYASDWASFTFNGLLTWIQEQQAEPEPEQPCDWSSLLQEGEELVHLNQSYSSISNLEVHSYVSEEEASPSSEQKNETVSEAETSPSHEQVPESQSEACAEPESQSEACAEPESQSEDSRDPKSQSESAAEPESQSEDSKEPESQSESATEPESQSEDSKEPESQSERRRMTLTDLVREGRRFNIDLVSKLLFSRGSLVDLLIQSNVSRYAEFKNVSRILTVLNGAVIQVPCSRADVFSSRQLSVVDKRKLMKFLTSCLDENDPYTDFSETPYMDFLEQQALGAELRHFLFYSIAGATEDTSTGAGLASTRHFLRCLGRYGNTPFLFPVYGLGEIPQCFCRMCAVFGGIYCLRHSAQSLIVHRDTNSCGRWWNSRGQRISCSHCVLEPGLLDRTETRRSSVMKLWNLLLLWTWSLTTGLEGQTAPYRLCTVTTDRTVYCYCRLCTVTADRVLLLQTVYCYYRLCTVTADRVLLLQTVTADRVLLLQTVYCYCRPCTVTADRVLLLQTVYCYYRPCTVTTDRVLLLQTVYCYYRLCTVTTDCVFSPCLLTCLLISSLVSLPPLFSPYLLPCLIASSLVSSLVSFTSSEPVEQVSCVYNQTCLLPCRADKGKIKTAQWIKTSVYVYHFEDGRNHPEKQAADYRRRTSLFPEEFSKGNASLQLSQVKVSDEGKYKCLTYSTVGSTDKQVHLGVEAPVETLNMRFEGDHLICSSDNIYPKPTVTWSPDSALQTELQPMENQFFSISSSLSVKLCPPQKFTCNISSSHSWKSATYSLNFSPAAVLPARVKSLKWTFNSVQTILTQTGADVSYSDTWRPFVERVSESGDLSLKNLSSKQKGVYLCEAHTDQNIYFSKTQL